MKMVTTGLIVAILCIGLISNVGSLATALNYPLGDTDELVSQSLGGLNHFALKDSVPHTIENYGYTESPKHQPLEIYASDDSRFDYMAASPYYKVFFKGTKAKMVIKDAWIEFELTGQQLGEMRNTEALADRNSLSVRGVFDSVDLSYAVDTSLLTEALTLKESKEFKSISQKISWGGITPEFQEDGSILFVDEKGKKVLRILPPFMKDALDDVSTGLHYELRETKTGYELHKILDKDGITWLEKAVYPVVIDPSMETFEDAWESSGLQPYGQYFQNLKEYINPTNGHLTITQTDLVIPGRGLDLTISRIYEMPAVFYGSDPYDYEAPPTDVGKGWLLNFPYIGSKYVHLGGGTVFKIVWSSNQFVNVRGNNFVLVKNGDNTYTLTTADGVVYEFNTSGKLTQIKDVDVNTISFTYTDGDLTSITDTIGRTVSLTYSNDRLWKISYDSAEIEYSYDENGCLVWMDDFLNRRTNYEYNSGYNNWLLSKIEYITEGYTTYAYNRFTDSDYYKYYITDQRVYETSQVRHITFSYTGDFDEITASAVTVKNESDVTQGSYEVTMSDGMVTQAVIKNSSGTPIRKMTRTYNSDYDITQESMYNDGSNLSFTNYYAYDDWGNIIYFKDAEGHERFFSYANTNTSGFFMDNNGTIIKTFANTFSNCTVSSSVHNALLGIVEKQDATYVKETYITYDSEAHPTQTKNLFGNTTTWLTFSGTFNEKTSSTSFPIDLTGHTVTGNGVLQITGLASDDIYLETKSFLCSNCPFACYDGCQSTAGSWSNAYYNLDYKCWVLDMQYLEQDTSIGPFTHKPGTLGYYGYSTTPQIGQYFTEFFVKAQWYAYPVEVQYKMNSESYTTVTSNLQNTTATHAATGFINNSSNTLYFTESSAQSTKFSWYLYVPVDNSPDTYTTTMTYDTYGNMTSITDAESNSATLTYSSTYSYAYLTEVSSTVGTDTITTKATYDSDRGWITSIQEPKGVDAGSGYDYLFTYDVLGRIIKKEFPLLPGQGQRSYLEAVYDCENRTTTIIDQLRHYIVKQYDKLGRNTNTKWYTGTFGTGTLYATVTFTYRYDNLMATITNSSSQTTTYTYDFLGRQTQITYPGSVSESYSYDDTNNKVTFTDARGYHAIFWYDWLSRLEKVEEEYAASTYASTTYQYNEITLLTSVTDAESHTTSFTYGSFFGLTKVTYPDSEYGEYEYDNVGNITSFADCKGNVASYTYDDYYRLTQIEYQDSGSWQYYKQISVTNFSSNYQYKITVHKGSGTDDATNVYLNNHCQNDFDDIRFRASDKTTELDHYRETYTDGSSAVFWVELPSTEQNIYIFYGNSSASSASNGENTFIFFDDCESGNATDTWTENDSGYGDISYVSDAGEYKYGSKGLEIMQTSTTNSYVVNSSFDAQPAFVLDFWVKQTDDVSYLRVQDNGTSNVLCRLWWDPDNLLKWYDNSAYVSTGYTYGSSWEHHELTFTTSDDKVVWKQDSVEIEDDAHEDSWTEGDLLDIFVGSKSNPGTAYFDNIYIRKHEATPPTVTFGSETANSDATQSVSFTYDLNSNRTRMDDDAPNTGDYVEYTYDNWNKLTAETRHISQSTYTVSYQYDVASRLTALTYPDSMQILYTYDDLNRTTEVKRYVDGSNDEILLDSVQYNTENLLTQFDYGNDLQATFSYDTRSRLSTLDVKNGETSFLDLDYTYDNNSNTTQLVNGWRDTSSTWHSETESYGYDGLNRLTSASCTSWSHTYSYDKAGSRTGKDSVTYTINTVNEVTALSDGTSFTYDDNGNRTGKSKGDDSWTYAYDRANRLTEVEKNSTTQGEYIYDGDGKRLQATENSVTTTYIHSDTNVLYEENSNGTATYIYGPTGLLAKRTTISQETNIFYYHTDPLESTRLVTDSSKNIVAAVTYKPFGELYVEEGSEQYLFTGKEIDATDLYYYGARYYDSETGRFLTRDQYTSLPDDPRFLRDQSECMQSLKDPQRLNRYSYGRNNPLKYTDPWGERICHNIGPGECDDAPPEATDQPQPTPATPAPPAPPEQPEQPEQPESPEQPGNWDCSECDCMNWDNIQDILAEKDLEIDTYYAMAVYSVVFCAAVGGLFGILTFGLGVAMGVICGAEMLAANELQHRDNMRDLFQKFEEAGCTCAYYCSEKP